MKKKRAYVKSGRPRKPYTRKVPAAKKKPYLLHAYVTEFNKTGDAHQAGKAFGVTGNAVLIFFKRNGVTLRRVAVINKPAA